MENQHRLIAGYRELSEREIWLMNEIKARGTDLEILIKTLRDAHGIDQRWVAIGVTDIQTGLMALVRAVAQPTTL